MRPRLRNHWCIQIWFFFINSWGKLWFGRVLTCSGSMRSWDSQGPPWSCFCYGGICNLRVSCWEHLWGVKLVQAGKIASMRRSIWGRQGLYTISWHLLDPGWNFSYFRFRGLNNTSIKRTFLFENFLLALIFNDQSLLMDVTLIHTLWAGWPFIRLLSNLIFIWIDHLSDWWTASCWSGHFWLHGVCWLNLG